MRHLLTLGAIFTIAAFLTSCGGDDAKPAPTSTTASSTTSSATTAATTAAASATTAPATAATTNAAKGGTEEDLKAAVRKSAEATFKGDAQTSYASYAKACRDQVSIADYTATLAAAKALYESATKLKLSDLKVSDVQVQDFTPTKAQAAAITSGTPKFQPWEYQDGAWVETDCASMKISTN